MPGQATIDPEFVESFNQPTVTPEFNEYLKSVASGSNQSHTPTAPNYVPADMVQPTKQAITSILNSEPFVDPTNPTEVVNPNPSTEGLNNNSSSTKTPTGSSSDPLNVTGNITVDIPDITVNVEIPEDDTISQTEYEESNQKDYDNFNATAQAYSDAIGVQNESLQAGETSFVESLTTDITNFTVPDFPTLQSFFPTLPFGSCIGFTINTQIGGVQRPMMIDQHCPPYNTYFNPLLTWALSIFTALYIFHLASRTIEET